ncbi:MAG TPA: glycosyltransferase family 2 protein [Verrucomicrobiae bacterium]|nr:glycosyltransferase family 2 protein [Verrucomicrobiae bacterium]
MQTRLPISVAVVTLNEEENLPRCLESVRELASQMVVLDCGSTDGTRAATEKFGAEFHFAPWAGYVAQKNKCLALCSQPWTLCLDADEALTPELAQSIRTLFASGEPPAAGYKVNRRTFYLGDWIWHSWYPEWHVRLVRRGHASWTGLLVHEYLEADGQTEKLAGDLLHYSFRDLFDHLQRTIKYSRLMAQSYHQQNRRFRWAQLLISPWLSFFKHLVLRSGWRDGWRGWLIAFSKWLDVFAKYAFLLEIERRQKGHP